MVLRPLYGLGWLGLALFAFRALANSAVESGRVTPAPARLQFSVEMDAKAGSAPKDGRLFVVLGKPSGEEPRLSIGSTGLKLAPVLARDVAGWRPGTAAMLDQQSALCPLANLSLLPEGEYRVQAVLATNQDLLLPNAPGNWFSKPVAMPESREARADSAEVGSTDSRGNAASRRRPDSVREVPFRGALPLLGTPDVFARRHHSSSRF